MVNPTTPLPKTDPENARDLRSRIVMDGDQDPGDTKRVCLKIEKTPKPNGFGDHYPNSMAISLGI